MREELVPGTRMAEGTQDEDSSSRMSAGDQGLQQQVPAQVHVQVHQVQPYLHQVSGHSCLFQHAGRGVVLKPLYPREHDFYTNMPADMRAFTPAFLGTAELRIQKEAGDHVTFYAYPGATNNNEEHFQDLNTAPQDRECGGLKVRCLNNDRLQVTLPTQVLPSVELRSGEDAQTAAGHVFWNLQLLHKLLLRVQGGPQKLLLLEDVTRGLSQPCVLDIKMGTRQHSDTATEQKRLNQIRKCQSTTSSSLGLRICGMKVFQEQQQQQQQQQQCGTRSQGAPYYLWCDKYYGRTLSVDGVHRLLRQFLHNGTLFRHDLLPSIIAQLRHIHDVMSGKEDLRFYSASLLVTYEGQETSSQQVLPRDSASSQAHTQGICKNNNQTVHYDKAEADAVITSSDSSSNRPQVRVHLVDFELVSDLGEDTQGPDRGLLFGLDNLIAIFERLQDR